MKILDSHKKIKWISKDVRFVNKSILLGAKSRLYTEVGKHVFSRIKIIAKKVSGNGLLSVTIKNNKNEILFSKNIKFTKTSSTEVTIDCDISLESGFLELKRPARAFGRVEVSRIIAEDHKKNSDNLELCSKERKASYLNSYLEKTSNILFKKNIAVIIPYGIYGGGEVYLKNIFSKTERNFNVDFLYLSKNMLETEVDNLHVRHRKVGNLNRLSSILSGSRYDVIIFYNSKKVYDTISALKKEKKIKSKVIEVYHSDFLWSDAIAKIRERDCVDLIFRVSDNLAEDISGVKSSNKIYMPVGINCNKFIKKESFSLRNNLSIRKGTKIFGMVARLSPEKNVQYALSLIKDVKDVHLIVVGSGPLDKALKEYAKSNAIENVSFVGYRKDVSEYYNIFDAFLLTSKIEGTPISILEAMSCGVPVFSTPVGQIENHFSHLDNVTMLSGSLSEDRSVLLEKKDSLNYCQILRDYIIENHNINYISKKFFANILSNSLSFVEKDDSEIALRGEYI